MLSCIWQQHCRIIAFSRCLIVKCGVTPLKVAGYFMYVEDADLTQKVLQKGTVWLAPQFSAIHAWHRAPMRDAGKFKMQLVSMGRYFKKWGCGKGTV